MAKEAYLIRRVLDGTMRTVQAFSAKGAMTAFVTDYRPNVGERFQVKKRGSGEGWTEYKVTS